MKTFFTLTAISFLGAAPFEIPRSDGGAITAYVDRPEANSYAITLIIPGSQKESSCIVHDALKADLLALNCCPISVEKRGIKQGKIDEKAFVAGLSNSLRLEDHLALIEKLGEGLLLGWNGKLSIIGQGDGGRIGASLAAKLEPVSALVLIGAGGGWTPLEEALYSFRKEMANQSYPPQYIQGFIVQAKQEFTQALKSPKPELVAFGYSYQYWESILKSNLLEDLTQADCPIYSVNGTQDDRVPIESVEKLAELLKSKLTLHKLEGKGREIIREPKTYTDAISWLQDKL